MRDPHVNSLLYRLECAPSTFQNPPRIDHDTAAFHVTLEHDRIKFDFKEHHATAQAAQDSVADFLLAWEIDAGLKMGPGRVQFVYERADLTDRSPPPPGESQLIGVVAIPSGEAWVSGTLTVARPTYPDPPKAFKVSPDVETMWNRYEGYCAKRELLPAMAYFCLTVIEFSAGARKDAREEAREATARTYGIHRSVLNKLGELTARGEPATARKMSTNLVPHSRQELEWIEAVVKAIIRRVAEVEAGASGPQIIMSDFPAL
jgi:hypothetical protein